MMMTCIEIDDWWIEGGGEAELDHSCIVCFRSVGSTIFQQQKCISPLPGVCLRTQRVIADWIYEAEYVIELLTYLSVKSNKQILFADNTSV